MRKKQVLLMSLGKIFYLFVLSSFLAATGLKKVPFAAINVFYQMFEKDEEKRLSGNHSSMLRTEVGYHHLPNREITSGSFGTSVHQENSNFLNGHTCLSEFKNS